MLNMGQNSGARTEKEKSEKGLQGVIEMKTWERVNNTP